MSIAFYCFSASPYTILYLVVSTLIAYVSTLFMEHIRCRAKQSADQSGEQSAPQSTQQSARKADTAQAVVRALTFAALLVNIIIWLVVKGQALWSFFTVRLWNFPSESFAPVAALGMGYYTMQIMGYIIDCSWGTVRPQRNPLKLFLFVGFFPQLVTGPISRYEELTCLYEKHTFRYENLCFGAQRILWGFFKKLVIVSRAAAIVNGYSADVSACTGFYAWIVILLYPLELYADFSGGMDIVLGVAELFDIRLPENFRNPFFARTAQEFWQRWHITLGTWARDYVLYPFLKSKPVVALGKKCKKRFGKKAGKFITTQLGMFLLWLVIGIWHGGIAYILGQSLWFFVILLLSDLTSSLRKKIAQRLEFKTESAGYHVFESIRTYVIYAIGAVFFAHGMRNGLRLLKHAAAVFTGGANAWVFFDQSILSTGITYGDLNILIVAVLLLFVVGLLREKYTYARTWMSEQSVGFRWAVWILLFVLVLLFGTYGPGYSAEEFIYQGF
jgi:D-alanyl-lipoteichoic acid acyltransferase DltB (MBOAT superfamily)